MKKLWGCILVFAVLLPIGFGTLVRCVATGKSHFSGGYRAGNCR